MFKKLQTNSLLISQYIEIIDNWHLKLKNKLLRKLSKNILRLHDSIPSQSTEAI